MLAGMKGPVRVPLEKLYLDPNNPRLADERPPGYKDPKRFLGAAAQATLEERVKRVYRVRTLVNSILGMGWVPVDAILAWELPRYKGRYLVVEGNTRTVALRTIHSTHKREVERLRRAQGRRARGDDEDDTDRRRAVVERYARVVEATRTIEVIPVAARGSAELSEALPRLLGVRHISHARQWQPHATNLYVLSLYDKAYREARGGAPSGIDEGVVRNVAATLNLSPWKTRRMVQTAAVFIAFRGRFGGRLPAGEEFAHEDQAYFQRLLEPGQARRAFSIGEDDLSMAPEMEQVFFDWAFSRPRRHETNHNIFRSADDVSLWNRIARYDAEHGTSFAEPLDAEKPHRARPMGQVELAYLAHREQSSPLEKVQALLDALKHIDVETLRVRREEVRPVVDDLGRLVRDYQALLSAID